VLLAIARVALLAVCVWCARPAHAEPSSVTLVGSLQNELGCSGDWQADCAATGLYFDGSDGVWQRSLFVPAGVFEYKVALDGSFAENYGANAQPNGPNLPLDLAALQSVKFYYDDATHWVTDSLGGRIVVAPGSYQSELGCPGDWQPDCLRSWLEDPDGDGVYERTTTALPAGVYEFKIAIGEAWDENYGDGGTPNGANVPFVVPTDFALVRFRFIGATNVPSVLVPEAGGAAAALVASTALAAMRRSRRR